MKMVRSLLLGTAAGLVAMSAAYATDLSVTARPAEYAKVNGYYMTANVSGGYVSAFYYQFETANGHGHFYTARLDTSANYDGAWPFNVNKLLVAGAAAQFGFDTSSQQISYMRRQRDPLTQRVMSSVDYRGSPNSGFSHVEIGKRPSFATKMIA